MLYLCKIECKNQLSSIKQSILWFVTRLDDGLKMHHVYMNVIERQTFCMTYKYESFYTLEGDLLSGKKLTTWHWSTGSSSHSGKQAILPESNPKPLGSFRIFTTAKSCSCAGCLKINSGWSKIVSIENSRSELLIPGWTIINRLFSFPDIQCAGNTATAT